MEGARKTGDGLPWQRLKKGDNYRIAASAGYNAGGKQIRKAKTGKPAGLYLIKEQMADRCMRSFRQFHIAEGYAFAKKLLSVTSVHGCVGNRIARISGHLFYFPAHGHAAERIIRL